MSLDLRNTPLAKRPAVVAGLSMRMTTAGATIIGGPAIYAALGVRHAGISTALLLPVRLLLHPILSWLTNRQLILIVILQLISWR